MQEAKMTNKKNISQYCINLQTWFCHTSFTMMKALVNIFKKIKQGT